MNGDSAAIIGRAASVQACVDYRADEWVGVPYAGIGHRLHVVMRVQQHGWSVDIDDFRTDDLPSARRAIGIVRLHHMRIDTYLVQLFGHELRGLFHMIRGNAFCGNGLQRDLFSTSTMRSKSASTRARISSACKTAILLLLIYAAYTHLGNVPPHAIE
jgi:hypothetical protein